MNQPKIIIYCDGALKGNCVVLPNKEPLITTYSKAVTNNISEYLAVIESMIQAIKHGHKSITILTDSKLVVEQVNENWKCNYDYLKILCDYVKGLSRKRFEQFEISWVSREDNLAGKVLEHIKF